MVFSPEVLLLHRDSHFTFSNNSLNIKCFIKIQLFVFYYIYHNFDSIYFDYENVHLVLFRYVLLTLFYLFFSNYQFYQLLSCLSKYNLHWEDSFWGFDCYNAIYRPLFQTGFYLESKCTKHPFPHCLTHWLSHRLTDAQGYHIIYRLFFQTDFYLEFNCTWHPFPHYLTHWLTDSLTFTLKMSSHL